MTLLHPLITSLQTLVEQAQSVPQEEAYLAQLTDRLAQVADERSRCVERLETGRAAGVKLATAERYLNGLISGVLVLPQDAALSVEEAVSVPVEQPCEPIVVLNSESISESAALPEPHESEALLTTEPDEVAPGAEIVALPSEDETASAPAISESNSEPELIEQQDEGEREAAEDAEVPALTIPERILEALAPDQQLTSRHLADQLSLTPGNVSSALSKMIASGRVKNDGNYPPRYRLPETAQASAPASASQEAPRDQEDRRAMRQVLHSTPAYTPPPVKAKPVTEQDEQAVLGALLARPTRRGSAALLSRGAAMSTDRVTVVLTHLAESGRVVAPDEGEHLWSLA